MDAFRDISTWGLIVGLIGLVVTSFGLYYAVQAKNRATDAENKAAGAESAAQAATAAANKRAAQDELLLLTRIGDDLLHSLQVQDWPRASECSAKMQQLMGEFAGQHRGSELLDEAEFGLIEQQVEDILGECSKMALYPKRATPAHRFTLHMKVSKAVHRLAKALGSIRNTEQHPGV